MAENTKIQWTDVTWNVAVGCSKVDSDCKYCYMYRQSLNSTRYVPNEVRKTKTVFNLPLKLKEPKKIFVSSLTDVYIEEIDTYRNEIWDIIRKCPQHTYQILTKRPHRILENTPEDILNSDNVYIGTSIGSQNSIHRLESLINNSPLDSKRFLSLEPLHGKVDLNLSQILDKYGTIPFQWVIVGGESGNENGKYKYRPCEINWIEDIVTDCKNHGVTVFVKQLGTYLSKKNNLKDRHGGDINEFPENLKVREFPF